MAVDLTVSYTAEYTCTLRPKRTAKLKASTLPLDFSFHSNIVSKSNKMHLIELKLQCYRTRLAVQWIGQWMCNPVTRHYYFWNNLSLNVSGVENESEILSHIKEDSVLGHSSTFGTENSIGNRLILPLEFIFFCMSFLIPCLESFWEKKKLGFKAKRKRLKYLQLQSV